MKLCPHNGVEIIGFLMAIFGGLRVTESDQISVLAAWVHGNRQAVPVQ